MSTAMAGLPPYSGPDAPCPRCGRPGAMTEWHWAGPLARQGTAGRQPPCAGRAELVGLRGEGEHLCRACLYCGYGWPEACIGQDGTPCRVPLRFPAIGAGLLALGGGLASTGAGSLLSLLFKGAALIAAWLTVTVALSVMAAIGYAVLADRRPTGLTACPSGQEDCR